jgi:hypothetical protein
LPLGNLSKLGKAIVSLGGSCGALPDGSSFLVQPAMATTAIKAIKNSFNTEGVNLLMFFLKYYG